MEKTREIIASSIGALANQALRESPTASVIGVTSKGIFIKNEKQDVLFISRETWRGPLTLNAPLGPEFLDRINPGYLVRIEDFRIEFLAADLVIRLENTPIWSCNSQEKAASQLEEALVRLSSVIDGILREPPVTPFLILLDALSSSPGILPDPYGLLPRYEALLDLYRGLADQDFETTLRRLIGFGAGLTPSGDDLLAGLAYSLTRLPDPNPRLQKDRLRLLTDPLLLQKTNRVSQGLIGAAAIGEVDERLLAAFEGILCGDRNIPEIISLLRSWGNSSGCDSLVGLGIGIRAKARLLSIVKENQ